MLKRRITILIHSLLLFSLVGYFPAFQIRQWIIHSEVKEKMKQNIPDSQLHQFNFLASSKLAVQIGTAHEFEYKGEMYDVVRRKIIGNQITLFCFHDSKESKLHQELEVTVNDRMDSGKYPIRQVFTNFEKVFHSTEVRLIKMITAFAIHENGYRVRHIDFYSFEFFRKHTPPPRILN